ncbi:MAG: hypothetical protein V7739_16925 [Motiliproteus sp.]
MSAACSAKLYNKDEKVLDLQQSRTRLQEALHDKAIAKQRWFAILTDISEYTQDQVEIPSSLVFQEILAESRIIAMDSLEQECRIELYQADFSFNRQPQ